jgi:hypothetical protein
MEVTEIRITRNYSLADQVCFKSTLLFASGIYRNPNSTIDWCDLYNSSGVKICSIKGYWFDYAGKELFEKVNR